jgi:BR serine/threonine kinase/MAP/microtubule affinity-regulating kinase
MMATQRMPFVEARINDPFYQLIAGNRAQYFWKKFEKVSDDLKDLLTGMMQLNTSARYTLEEVMIHPWFDGPIATEKEIIAEFKARKYTTDTFKKEGNRD